MARRAEQLPWTGVGISLGAGLGMIIGLLISGGAGIAVGLVVGGGIGLVIGAAATRTTPPSS